MIVWILLASTRNKKKCIRKGHKEYMVANLSHPHNLCNELFLIQWCVNFLTMFLQPYYSHRLPYFHFKTHLCLLFLYISISTLIHHPLFLKKERKKRVVFASLVKKMGRGKTQLRRIENATSRQVTFSKRRNGLLKKAFELSVLCDAEVALIIFSPRSKLYEFASSSMKETVERYRGHVKETRIQKSPCPEDDQHMRQLAAGMAKEIELLEVAKRKILGEGLGSSTIDELLQTEQQLERSVCIIRSRKMQVYSEKVEQLQSKEKMRITENAELKEKHQLQMLGDSVEREENFMVMVNEDTSDVETELFIGQPKRNIDTSRLN